MNDLQHSGASTVERVLQQLKSATKPVSEVLHRNDHFQVIVLGLNADVALPDHLTKVPAKLTVLSGSVVYQDADGTTPLFCYDEMAIPLNVTHSVRATRRSICLLTRG